MGTHIFFRVFVLSTVSVFWASGAAMGGEVAYLKIPGVRGETIDSQIPDEIEVLSWKFAMSNSDDEETVELDVSDFVFRKHLDRASPNLAAYIVDHRVLDGVVFTVIPAGAERNSNTLRIDMDGVIFTSVSATGSGSKKNFVEKYALCFRRATFSYQPLDEIGAPVGGRIEWVVMNADCS